MADPQNLVDIAHSTSDEFVTCCMIIIISHTSLSHDLYHCMHRLKRFRFSNADKIRDTNGSLSLCWPASLLVSKAESNVDYKYNLLCCVPFVDRENMYQFVILTLCLVGTVCVARLLFIFMPSRLPHSRALFMWLWFYKIAFSFWRPLCLCDWKRIGSFCDWIWTALLSAGQFKHCVD